MAETYNDYPQSATNNAKKVLKWRDEHGRDEVKGGTAVGWTRANQLAKREKISRETIGRMAAFKRHEKNAKVDEKYKSTPWKDKGYVAWLLWGGTSGVNWAIKKKESIDNKAKNIKTMDKIKKISLSGAVETDITLNDLVNQAGDVSQFETLILDIASPGGCVEEGLKIMIWLDSISQKGKEVITVVSANAYSIASLIMLAADKRYISRHGEVMVHNPMVPFIEYANANELEKHISELRMLEEMLQNLYQQFANISIEDIKVLMDNETYLSPDDAVARGFADLVIDVKPRSFEMVAVKNKLNMSKTKNMLNIVIAAVNGEKFVNQMYYNTKGDEIQIFQANPAKYGIGDKTSIEEGEVRLSDGTKLSILNYEISNIEKEVEKVEEVVAEEKIEDAPVSEEVKEEAPVAEEVKEETPVAEDVKEEKPVAEFNEGPAPKEIEEAPKAVAQAIEPAKEEAPVAEVIEEVAPVASEEEKIAEPKMEEPAKVEVEEVIASIEDEPKAEPVAEEEIPAVEPKMEEEVVEEVDPMVEHQKAMDDMVSRIEALEAKIGASEEFEALATEAIDTLARNTSSAFKPEARKVAKVDENYVPKSLSIFQKMRYNK